MTELPGSDRPLVERYQTVLSDLDGVVYRSTGAVPHAVAALAEIRAAGHRPVFVTNGAARTPAQVAALLTDLGVPARDREVVTAG